MNGWGMKRIWAAGAVAMLLASSSASALAAPKGEPVVRVMLSTEADGLRAAYVLPRPVTSFTFEEAVADVRGDTWKLPPGMTLVDGVLARKDGNRFSSFIIHITPDTQPRDRRYPALTRVGEGWQVYGPYFTGAEGQPKVEVLAVAWHDWISAPAAVNARLPLDGTFYFGPLSLVTKGAATVAKAPNIEPALQEAVDRGANRATAYYEKRLGIALPTRPTLIITRIPTFTVGWQGDTTDGFVASLRFFGPAAEKGEDPAQVEAFVNHEFFHFWNSRLARSRHGETQAWLHEGMAEYAALLAARESGARSEAEVADALAGRLTACAAGLQGRSLDTAPPKRGKAIYDCGVVVQWATDLKTRAASGGTRDVFDVWRELFDEARKGDGQYDAAAFYKLAGRTEAADDPLRLLGEAGDDQRWSRLTASLQALGARITPTRSVEAEQTALLFHLLDQACKGSRGFYGGDPDAVKLDTTQNCGALNGDPKVDKLAGLSLTHETSALFDALGPICEAKGEVAFTYQGKPVASVACTKPMPPRPLAWTVAKWR